MMFPAFRYIFELYSRALVFGINVQVLPCLKNFLYLQSDAVLSQKLTAWEAL